MRYYIFRLNINLKSLVIIQEQTICVVCLILFHHNYTLIKKVYEIII